MPPNELRGLRRCVFAEIGFGEDDRAGLSQTRDERRIVGRAIVRVAASAPDVVRMSNVSY